MNVSLRLKHAGWIGRSIDVLFDQPDLYIGAADTTAAQVWLDPPRTRSGCAAQGAGIVMGAARLFGLHPKDRSDPKSETTNSVVSLPPDLKLPAALAPGTE